jgi:hypothetical protein
MSEPVFYPKSLAEIESRFRRCIESSSLDEARILLEEYSVQAAHLWQSEELSESARQELPRRTQELISWTRQIVSAQRAQFLESFAVLPDIRPYASGVARLETWCVEG